MNRTTSLIWTSAMFLIVTNISISQTAEQSKRIMSSYNQEKLEQLSTTFSKHYIQESRKAQLYAKQNNIPVEIKSENGGISILERIQADGTLIYTTTYNRGAGITVGADKLYPNGNTGLGLSLEGEGMRIGVWDGGRVLETHELLGKDRVTNLDLGSSINSHATHVTGTLIGSDQVANGAARGLAYKATVQVNDFTNDLGEMATQAAAGLLISNHSYGYDTKELPTYYFGRYDEKARSLDQLLHNAPYYTVVTSAGNDRNSESSLDPGNPGDDGYDLLTDMAVAKNNIVVAAVEEVLNYLGPESVAMSKFSSWGPTDDGRIKPDISAKGVLTYSSISNSNTAYAKYTGTSMAAPNVTGALTLLQELQRNIHGNFMKAATLKALAIHTASEAGASPGPDYKFGWGLLNVEEGAKVILKKNFQSLIEENTLTQGSSYSKTIKALGTEPLKITIAWTDPAGILQSTTLDAPTSRLVNDLDVVLIDASNNKTYPWKLNPSSFTLRAIKGVNSVDNVEKIELNALPENYTIKISHKGNLQSGSQNFSLIISGIDQSDFALTPDSGNKTFCSDEIGIYRFNYESKTSYVGSTNLTVIGLPTGAIGTITPAVVTGDQDFDLKISGLNNVLPGQYTITLKANGAGIIKSYDLILIVENGGAVGNTILTYPNDGAISVFIKPTVKWGAVSSATDYKLEVSTTSNFDSLIYEALTTSTSMPIPRLLSNTKYYWRVKPYPGCYDAPFTASSFTTESLDCSSQKTSATDLPKTIPLNAGSTTSTINIQDNILIGNVQVALKIDHSYVSDMKVSLVSPAGTEVVIIDGACGNGKNVNVTFDDNGSEFECGGNPIISDIRKPLNALSSFIGENAQGDWTLKILDRYDEDGGTLMEFELILCNSNGTLSVRNNTVDGFVIHPNPAENYFEFSLLNQQQDVKIAVYDMNGRLLINTIFDLQASRKVDVNNLSAGVYFVEITNGNQKGTKKLIVR